LARFPKRVIGGLKGLIKFISGGLLFWKGETLSPNSKLGLPSLLGTPIIPNYFKIGIRRFSNLRKGRPIKELLFRRKKRFTKENHLE